MRRKGEKGGERRGGEGKGREEKGRKGRKGRKGEGILDLLPPTEKFASNATGESVRPLLYYKCTKLQFIQVLTAKCND